MGRCYSLDLRVRVAAFVEAGHSRRAAARHFGVSDSFAIKLVRRQRQVRIPRSGPTRPPAGGGKLAPYETFLVHTVETEARHHHAGTRRSAVGGAWGGRRPGHPLASAVPARLHL